MFEFGFRKGTKKPRRLRAESTWNKRKVLIRSSLLPPPYYIEGSFSNLIMDKTIAHH